MYDLNYSSKFFEVYFVLNKGFKRKVKKIAGITLDRMV